MSKPSLCSECKIGPQLLPGCLSSSTKEACRYKCQKCKKSTFVFLTRDEARRCWESMNLEKESNDRT